MEARSLIEGPGSSVFREYPKHNARVTGFSDVSEDFVHHHPAVSAPAVVRKTVDGYELRVSVHAGISCGVPVGDAVRLSLYLEDISVSTVFIQQRSEHVHGFCEIGAPFEGGAVKY